MVKMVVYKGKEYGLEFKWSGSTYCVRALNNGSFVGIPNDCLDDIEKMKPYMRQAIDDKKNDLKEISKWNGVL